MCSTLDSGCRRCAEFLAQHVSTLVEKEVDMSEAVLQDAHVGRQDDFCQHSLVVIEVFDQWNNPSEAHAAMCWCAPPAID
jgi:hypothetical protein